MKATLKIIALLGIIVAAGGALVWLARLHRPGSSLTTAAHATTGQASVPQLTAPVAKPAPSPKPPAPATIPEHILPIVTATPQTRFAERVKMVRALNADLKPNEVQAFYAYLLAPAQSSTGERQGENWLRNVILDKLVEQSNPSADLPAVLVSIYQNQEQDIVMRDYAVQHMNPAYPRANEEEKTALSRALWQATEETDSSIAGTALLALNDLARNHPEFNRDQIAQTALKLAGDEHCGELARITAVQLCGQKQVTQAATLVLQLAQSASSMPLRIAAIAALGDLGDQDAETFLQGIAAGGEDRLKPAAQTALKRLEKRLGT
jgi:hypothetical protein